MIRREAHGQFFLITQHDHALLSGWLAERVGNTRVAKPQPYEPTIRGISLHDSGWPLHDDQPTLNPRGIPLDVFETPREIGLKVWQESVERAASADAYSGLLVSLHVLSLSYLMFEMHSSMRDRFEINKFQHREIERQEELRRQIGLRTDLPLEAGLARRGIDAREDWLTFNFRLLQAMDRVSLALCCTNEPFGRIDDFLPGPNRERIAVELRKDGENGLIVDPWLFNARTELHCEVPCRALPAQPFDSEPRFRDAYANAAIEMLRFSVRPTK